MLAEDLESEEEMDEVAESCSASAQDTSISAARHPSRSLTGRYCRLSAISVNPFCSIASPS